MFALNALNQATWCGLYAFGLKTLELDQRILKAAAPHFADAGLFAAGSYLIRFIPNQIIQKSCQTDPFAQNHPYAMKTMIYFVNFLAQFILASIAKTAGFSPISQTFIGTYYGITYAYHLLD